MTFKKYQIANNVKAQLDVGISAGGSNLVLKAGFGALYPAHNGTTDKNYLGTLVKFDTDGVTVLKREIVEVIARSGDSFAITRGFGTCPGSDTSTTQATTAYAFDADDYFFLNNTAELIKDIQDETTNIVDVQLPLKLDVSVYNQDKIAFASTSTGNDDYSISVPTISAYTNGQTVKVQADVANSGSATLQINALGQKTLKKLVLGAFANLVTGDIIANQIFRATYNTTEDCFQFSVDPASVTIPTIETTQFEFVAGEAITQGNAIRKGNASIGYPGETEAFQTGTQYQNDRDSLGYNTTYQRLGQSITIGDGGYLQSITLHLKKQGTPTGNITCKLYTGAGTGLVATSTNVVQEATLTSSRTGYAFNFGGQEIAPGTYYIELSVDRANSTGNFTFWGAVQGGGSYAGGDGFYINSGGTRTGIGYDRRFSVVLASGYEDATKVYLSKALTANKTEFVGFATNSASIGGSVVADTGGITMLLSGLTAGANYYLSDTAGAIATTPGTNKYCVGKAITTDGLFIDKQSLLRTTQTPGASPYTYQNTLGFPLLITITGGTVSAIAISRDGTNFFQIGSATNTQVILQPLDYVKVTYSSAPAMTIFYQ